MAIDGLLIDLEGVLAVAWEPMPGAVDALAELRDRGVPWRVVTNTTTDPGTRVAQRLADAGFDVGPHDVVSVATATGAFLREHHPGARCLLLNEGDLSEDLRGVDLVEDASGPVDGPVDVVVLGGAGPSFTYERLNHAFRCLSDGAVLVAMHRNLAWAAPDGLTLDTGAYVAGLERATGLTATVVGKPAAPFFLEAVRQLGLPPERVAMVGDDLHDDVLGAQACGLTGVLVRTGKFREETLAAAHAAPDRIIDSFADAPGLVA